MVASLSELHVHTVYIHSVTQIYRCETNELIPGLLSTLTLQMQRGPGVFLCTCQLLLLKTMWHMFTLILTILFMYLKICHLCQRNTAFHIRTFQTHLINFSHRLLICVLGVCCIWAHNILLRFAYNYSYANVSTMAKRIILV